MGAMPNPDEPPVITDAPERGRYEAHLDGTLAGILEYTVRRDRIILVHTEVFPEFEGRGVAAAITRFALDDARRLGRRVIVACPYVKRYLARHPEDLDIVIGNTKA
jgi:predicted GNAT family acetyltransferase